MIAIIDYGVGNLFSLSASLNYIGASVKVTGDPQDLKKADHIILPGVGAFCDARQKLENSGLMESVLEEAASGKPFLGICLGMQMLFDRSMEYGVYPGLGLVPGEVRQIETDLKIPQIGWNKLDCKDDPLFKYSGQGDYVYFVHSFAAYDCQEHTIATTQYGGKVTAAVRRGNVYGTQFHPEKSGEAGLNILRAFMEL